MANLGVRNGTKVRGAGDVVRGYSVASAELDATAVATASITAASAIVAWAKMRSSPRCATSLIPVTRDNLRRRLVITEPGGGADLGEIAAASWGTFSAGLGEPSSWSATVEVDDPQAALVDPSDPSTRLREAKMLVGDLLLGWGPIVRPAATQDQISVQCKGPEWHFSRRSIGPSSGENLLANGDFEAGLSGWNVLRHAASDEPELAFILQPPSTTAFAAITDSLVEPYSGTRCLRLVEANVFATEKPFVFQDILYQSGPVDETITFTAWLRVQSSGFNQHNPRSTGLLLGVLPFNYRTLNYPGLGAPLPPQGFSNMFWAANTLDFFALSFARLSQPPVFDTWEPYECSVRVPADTQMTIQARIEGPAGTLFADRCAVRRSRGLHFVDADQTSDIAADLVDHLQDPAFDHSDVNIVAKCQPSGVKRTRSYWFSERPNGAAALDEFAAMRNGFDYGITLTPSERRYVTYYPERGRLRNLRLSFPGNLVSFAYAFDGERAANVMLVVGDGSTEGREVSAATDETSFAGLTLEEIFRAPDGTPPQALDEIAEEELERALEPVVLAAKTWPMARGIKSAGRDATQLLGRAREGDFVPVRVRHGVVDVDDVFRIVRWGLTADDELEFVLNRRGPR